MLTVKAQMWIQTNIQQYIYFFVKNLNFLFLFRGLLLIDSLKREFLVNPGKVAVSACVMSPDVRWRRILQDYVFLLS